MPPSVFLMTDGTITQHPNGLNSRQRVCDPQHVDWVWFGRAHRRIQNLLTSQHVNNKPDSRAKQMKGGHDALRSWTRIRARKCYLFRGPLEREVYMTVTCLLGLLASTQQLALSRRLTVVLASQRPLSTFITAY